MRNNEIFNTTDTYKLIDKESYLAINLGNKLILENFPQLFTGFKFNYVDLGGFGWVDDYIVAYEEEKIYFQTIAKTISKHYEHYRIINKNTEQPLYISDSFNNLLVEMQTNSGYYEDTDYEKAKNILSINELDTSIFKIAKVSIEIKTTYNNE